jgi:hypothetical protein
MPNAIDRSLLAPTRLAGLLVAVGLVLAGCASGSGRPAGAPAGASDTGALTDADYLTADRWNDGRAEVAFYRVERSTDPYGEPRQQSFTVGTYLVKHRFSPEKMTKVTNGSGTSAFKYALFYEVESGSYQYKRNWVVNARQRDLAPLKQSFTSFDWCSNQYREIAFPPDGPATYLRRSDDYGNEEATLEAGPTSVPAALVPMLLRGLSFADTTRRAFEVVRPGKAPVGAVVRHAGADTVETPAGTIAAERLEVTYDGSVPSLIAAEAARSETYWRATGPYRRLVKMQGGDGAYTMTLVEERRTAYWNENIWPMLERVDARP